MANQDYGTSETAGKSYDDLFQDASDAIWKATEDLDGEDVIDVCLGPIACLVSTCDGDGRKEARRRVIQGLDEQIKDMDDLDLDQQPVDVAPLSDDEVGFLGQDQLEAMGEESGKRALMVDAVLAGGNDAMVMMILTSLLGRHVGSMEPEERSRGYARVLRELDRQVKDWTIHHCDA